MVRTSDWLAVPELESPATVPDAPAPIATPVITCASGGTVPKTGWYEGALPSNHPNHAYFSKIPGRFVRKHAAERMLTLGVVPLADEALVVWTWLRESQPALRAAAARHESRL